MNWPSGEKRKPAAGTCRADVSCETRCSSNSHATHLNQSTIFVVSAVAVASGPDGEFIFSVEHGEDVRMADTVTALEGFGAQITSESEGVLEATAHDPDPGN